MRQSSGTLRLIAAFKLLKAAMLIAAGVFVLTDAPALARLAHFVPRVMTLLRAPKRLEELGIGAFAYAALFIAEGTGLWMNKRWAEWLTIIATASFIPFEIYEIAKKPTALRIGALVINVAVLVYLIVRRVRRVR